MTARAPIRPLRPSESFHSIVNPSDYPSIGCFWTWAFSDLASNTVRGVLAEFLVGTALGVDFSHTREAWDDFDLLTLDGIRVEVKATGYLQAWESKEAVPTFKGLRGMALTEDKSLYQGESRVRADVFVFCVHTERNPEFYDPLLIDAWEFYVVPADVIDKTNQKTIRL
ncbi:MAG: hypothetical protein HQL77_16795, partial [Magnetococcales bacterium]|nr:hypothetical protein [Magnetococcales bacterium]